MVSIVHNLSSTFDIVLGKQAEGKVTPAGKTRGSRKSLADDEFPNGSFFSSSCQDFIELVSGKLELKITTLEKTCHDLAKKVSDMDGSMRKLIRTTTDKMTLDIRQLEQAHKSTKAYVEQKTCTAMEALGELGNAVHRTLENMVEVLDEVPQELRDALQDIAGGPTGEEADSALEGLRVMQSRWADLANLVDGLIPKSKEVGVVARSAQSPTPPQGHIVPPAVDVRQDSADATPAASTAEAVRQLDIVVTNGVEKVDIEMGEDDQVGENGKQAGEVDGNEPMPMQQNNGQVERSIDGNPDPSGGVDGLSELTVESRPSPPAESPAKRKLEDDADEAPTEKKKKKAAAPKKKASRRKVRGKGADASPAAAEGEDVDAEGEEVEA